MLPPNIAEAVMGAEELTVQAVRALSFSHGRKYEGNKEKPNQVVCFSLGHQEPRVLVVTPSPLLFLVVPEFSICSVFRDETKVVSLLPGKGCVGYLGNHLRVFIRAGLAENQPHSSCR